jgi:hypothetical protein
MENKISKNKYFHAWYLYATIKNLKWCIKRGNFLIKPLHIDKSRQNLRRESVLSKFFCSLSLSAIKENGP